MGFRSFKVNNPNVLTNALIIGYRHFDLAERYNNLKVVSVALKKYNPFSKLMLYCSLAEIDIISEAISSSEAY